MLDTIIHPLVDTHCHLNFSAFKHERDQILVNASRAGVQIVINPGIDIESSREVIELCHIYSQLYAAVGIHPNEATTWNSDSLGLLEDMAQSDKVVAIGEIGLDYYRDYTPRSTQIKVLEEQLQLASRLGLPVILHNRDAEHDLVPILESWQNANHASGLTITDHPGVFHSFSASTRTAADAIRMNFFIGVTGPVTFPNAKELQQVIAQISLDHLLIETDAPFLAPQPRRGKRNEPAFVYFIAQKIAEVQQKAFQEVAEKTTANARLLFQIGEKPLV